MKRPWRLARGASAAALVLASARAEASEFSGLAALVAGIFVGLPLGIMVIAFCIASLVLASRTDVRPLRRTYSKVAIVASALTPLLYVASALALEGSASMLGLAALFSLPLVVASLISIWLALRVLRRNPVSSETAA